VKGWDWITSRYACQFQQLYDSGIAQNHNKLFYFSISTFEIIPSFLKSKGPQASALLHYLPVFEN